MASRRNKAGSSKSAFRAELADFVEPLTDVATWVWYPRTEEAEWSDNLFGLLGYEPGEIEPSPRAFCDHVHPLDRERIGETLWLAERSAAEIEFRLVRADGEVRHVRSHVHQVVASADPRAARVLGALRDVTEMRQLDRVLAAHVAVGKALGSWDGVESGGRRLLQGIAEAMEFDRGGLLVPSGDVLVAMVVWDSAPPRCSEDALRATRLPSGSGVSGSAWERRAPVAVSHLADERLNPYRRLARDEDVRGALGIPALAGGDVLAVLSFVSREEVSLPERAMKSVMAIGHQIGQFLNRRRGELNPTVLTVRQREVLRLVADGMHGAQIADQLSISVDTVRSHLTHIYELLDVHDRAAAVAKALRLGLID